MRYWTTPPYRPNRSTFWQQSFYNYPVDALPTRPSTDLNNQITYNSQFTNGTRVNLNTVGTDDWVSGFPADVYFIDRYPPGPVTYVNYNFPFSYFGVTPGSLLSMPNPYPYFPGQRQEGAQYSSFLDFFDDFIPGNLSPGSWVARNPDTSDTHCVVWVPQANLLMELIKYSGGYLNNEYNVGAAVKYDLTTYTLPSNQNTPPGPAGVVAACIPVAPFAFTYQDLVDAGEGDLGHMLGFVLPEYRTGFRWPARASDGTRSTGLVNGAVLRLKSTVNPSTLFPNSQPLRVLARTLQRYGMLMFDKTGEGVGTTGLFCPADPAWPSGSADLGNIWNTANITLSDFEEVEMSSLMVSANSIEVQVASNTPPITFNSNVSVQYNTPTQFTFQAFDEDGDPLTFQIVSGPYSGTVEGTGQTRIYTPNTGSYGYDYILFTASDGQDTSAPATVNFNVLPPAPPLPQTKLRRKARWFW